MRARIESLARMGIDLLHREVADRSWSWRLLSDSEDGRSVFEYAAGNERVIGKFYKDASGLNSFRALEQLFECKFETLRVPRPIFYGADELVLLVGRAEGKACQAMPLAGSGDCLKRIGRSLRDLHGCAIDLGDTKGIGDHLAELVNPAPETLANAFPRYAEVIQTTLDLLRTRGRTWHETSVAPLHRDFHLRQLFDDGIHITVIDWDLCARGDPAFDVAYMTAYLKTHYPHEEAAQGVESFLAGYQPSREVMGRVPYYEQFNWLRRACRRFRLKDAGWKETLHTMLGQLRSPSETPSLAG